MGNRNCARPPRYGQQTGRLHWRNELYAVIANQKTAPETIKLRGKISQQVVKIHARGRRESALANAEQHCGEWFRFLHLVTAGRIVSMLLELLPKILPNENKLIPRC